MRIKVEIEDSVRGDKWCNLYIYPDLPNPGFSNPYQTKIIDLPKDMVGEMLQRYYEEKSKNGTKNNNA